MLKKLLIFTALWFVSVSALWAQIQTETLNFVANTGGTSTTVTTSFQYKAVILKTHAKTTEGESAGAVLGIGFSDCTNKGSIAWVGDDAVSTTNAGRTLRSDAIIEVGTNGNPTFPTRATGVTCNATSLVLTFTVTPASAWEMSVIGIGGADITNVFVGTATLNTGAGNQTISGVGFQGDFLMALTTGQTGVGTVVTANGTFGVATSSTSRWSLGAGVRDGQTTSAAVNGESRVRNDQLLHFTSAISGATLVLDFVEWNSDGYVINISNNSGAVAALMPFMVIKGGQWATGVEAKPTTASVQDFTIGFTPKLFAAAMSSATALNTLTSDAITTLGAWDGTTEIYAGAYHNDAINTVAKSAGGSTKVLCELNATACADGATLADPTEITWDATGTAFLTAWFAAGDNASSPGGRRAQTIVSELRK